MAQTLSRAEYWADSDPGIGLATNILGLPVQSDISNFNFNVTAQSPGFHTVGIRSKDAAGKWSHTNFVSVFTYPTPTVANIVKIKYWIDSDPGFAGGTILTGAPTQPDISNFSFAVPSLSPGFHFLGIRSLDAAGKWSHTNIFSLYTYPAPSNANIVAIRYWVDSDPGFSAGTTVTGFTSQPDVNNHSFVIPPLSNGFHIIGVRSKSADGKWSHTNFHTIYVSDQTVYNINRIEYYWGSTDPGFGNAADTTFSVAINDLNNGVLTLQNPPSQGTYNLFLRTRDTQGRWSHTNYVQNVIITDCSSFTISVSNGNLSLCQGQSGVVTASNGNSYTWTPSAGLSSSTTASVTISPTVSTTYTVTGVSGGCSDTKTVAVIVNANPNVSATASNSTICNGSSSTLTASGASTYQWSNSLGTSSSVTVTPTTSTTYTVTGTNSSNCTASATVSIAVNANPNVSATASNSTICNGSSSTLTASGASTYQWSNSLGTSSSVTVTPTTSTTYTVTGTNSSNCTASATVSIAVNANPNVTISASTDSVCAGSSVVMNASGASTYQWSNNAGTGSSVTATPVNTTTYSVVGTDGNSCTGSATQIITVVALPPTPSITVTNNTTLTCTIIGSSYQWYLNGTPINGATSQTYTATQNGNYSVVILNNFGCESSASASVNVIINGVQNIQDAMAVLIYPNPNDGHFVVQSESFLPDDVICLHDMLGRICLQQTYNSANSIDISSLPSGTYLLSISRQSSSLFRYTVVKY